MNKENSNNKGDFMISKENLNISFAPLFHINTEDLWMFHIDFNLKNNSLKTNFIDVSEVSLIAPFKVQSIKSIPTKLENDEDENEITTIFFIELPAEEKKHFNACSVNMLKVLLKMEFKVARISFSKEFHAGKISRYYMNIRTDTGYTLNIKTLPVI